MKICIALLALLLAGPPLGDPQAEHLAKARAATPLLAPPVGPLPQPALGLPQVDAGRLPHAAARRLAGFARQPGNPPVLLPDDPAWLAGAVATTGRRWYGLHFPMDGATLYLHGSTAALRWPGAPAMAPPTLEAPLVSRAHAVVTVSFGAFGAAYVIDLECERRAADERCAGDDFVTSLARGLARFEP